MDAFMELAIQEAVSALADGDYPFGSILVRNGQVIGVGRNHINTHNDPTSHAEIEALRAAGLQENYANTIMYASAFPCIMCAGSIVRLGVPKIIVGASWQGCESSRDLLEAYGVEIEVLELDECKALLNRA